MATMLGGLGAMAGYSPASMTTANVWYEWNNAYYVQTGTTAATTQVVWNSWNYQYQTCYGYQSQEIRPDPAAQRREQERVERRLAAQEKAKQLLVSALDEKQRTQFEKEKHFELEVGDRLYRIKPGQRVERLDRETRTVKSYFCIHPSHEHDLPGEDVALAQKLLLESAEAEFLRIANETRAA